MKRIRILVQVIKQYEYEYEEQMVCEEDALRKAFDMAVEEGEVKQSTIEDYDIHTIEPEWEPAGDR